jgi:hypothetical protein
MHARQASLLYFFNEIYFNVENKFRLFYYLNHENQSKSLLQFQGSLVFVVGKMDGLLMVSGRRHNADDIVATGLAVESIKTVYRGR